MTRTPLAVALMMASAACRSPATEVLIAIGSDAPPSRHFEVRVSAHTGDDAGGAVTVIARAADAGETLGSFAVIPSAQHAAGEAVTVVFEANLAGGAASEPAQQWRRTVRFRFATHATLSLPVFLPVYCGNHSDDCTSVPTAECTVAKRCEERGLTCGDRGACVAADVTPTGADAGIDASPDASVTLDDCASSIVPGAPTVLADFEDRMVPLAGARPVGFAASNAPELTIIDGGAQGSVAAAHVAYDTSGIVSLEGAAARQYLSGGTTLDASFGNAIEFDVRVPTGSTLLSDVPSAATFTVATSHWRPGDPSVGVIPDSAMQNFARFAVQSAGADRWLHVVLSAAAFTESLEYYHFFAAAAGTDELPFIPSIRELRIDQTLPTVPANFDIDEIRVITLPPIAQLCPAFVTRTVSAAGGDVLIPVDIINTTTRARTYRMYLSSEVHVAREDQLRAYAAAMDGSVLGQIAAIDGSDGGRGAVELFESDASGRPMGPSITVAGGLGVVVPPSGVFHGVVVHHVVSAMLGTPYTAMYGSTSITTRRDTLTTSLIVWDPDEPSHESPEIRHVDSNADPPRVMFVAPGFPASALLPIGWTSRDVRADQAVGTFVSILRLTP